MAEKRMFAKAIIDSDAFIEMPVSARLLYFDLGMRADDDGFVNNPKKIIRMTGASTDDMNILISKKFVILFESGIIVIKHWRINNYLRIDRYKPTNYLEEKGQLLLNDNGSYSLLNEQNMLGIPCGIPLVDADKSRLDKIKEDKSSKDKINNKKDKPTKHKYGEYKNVLLSDEQMEKLKTEFPDYEERIERVSEYCASTGKSYKDYLATIRAWAKKEKKQNNTDKGLSLQEMIEGGEFD